MTTEGGYTKRQFFSRRNNVTLQEKNGVCFVQKIYEDLDSAQRERDCYALLLNRKVIVPTPLYEGLNELHLTYIRGMTALELLDGQETESLPCIEHWHTLTAWCCDFYRKSGLVLGDPNLRNFIIESDSGNWFGVDFECCGIGNPGENFAKLLAFLLCYSPEGTSLKQRISEEMRNVFSKEMLFDKKQLEKLQVTAVMDLLQRRKKRKNQKALDGAALPLK